MVGHSAEYWQAAIDTEYQWLQERHTWSLVVKLAGRKIVDSKWVFKVKMTSDGTIFTLRYGTPSRRF